MPTAYACCGGQVEVDDLAEERVGDLHQDAGAVTGVRLGARGAAVLEVAQRGQRLRHDVVAGHAGQGRHEGDATGVVLVARRRRALGAAGMRAVGGHSPVVVCARRGPMGRPSAAVEAGAQDDVGPCGGVSLPPPRRQAPTGDSWTAPATAPVVGRDVGLGRPARPRRARRLSRRLAPLDVHRLLPRAAGARRPAHRRSRPGRATNSPIDIHSPHRSPRTSFSSMVSMRRCSIQSRPRQ